MITLLHPSRGRAIKALETYRYWISKSSGEIPIEHIVSVDESDPAKDAYFKLFTKGSLVIANYNTCVVEAANRAAKISTGDILIYLSDDFKCPQDWDKKIIEKFGGFYNGSKEPKIIKVDDCLQPFTADVLTIPIMNRYLYERLGYFFHHGYKSMFCDQDLFWVCKNNGWLRDHSELKFEHEHYSIGKAPRDETYMRSDANWNEGKAFYAKRKQEGFPL